MPGINIGKNSRQVKILASQITRELERQTNNVGHCAIYENELQRIWPLDEKDREKNIAQFARDHGFYLSFYKAGLCAIFIKEPMGVSL